MQSGAPAQPPFGVAFLCAVRRSIDPSLPATGWSQPVTDARAAPGAAEKAL